MDLRVGLDGCEKKTRHHRDSTPEPSSPQRVAIPTELSRPTLRCGAVRKCKVMEALLFFRV